jgi:hypothetical protein
MQMLSMKAFAQENSDLRLREMDFANLPHSVPVVPTDSVPLERLISFSAESALQPLLEQIDQGGR